MGLLTPKTYAIVTSVIFSVVAVVHIIRLIANWELIIGGWNAPAWVSIVGAVIPGYLSLEGCRIFRQSQV